MHNKKLDVDIYPEFARDMTDNPHSSAFLAEQVSAQRTASYDRDIEHASIVFSPGTVAKNGWASIPDDDDSSPTLASMPGAVMQSAYIHSETEVRTFVQPAVDVRHKQSTPPSPHRLGWLRILVVSVLGLALAAAAGWGITELRNPDTLPLRSVRIEGAFTHVTTEDLQQAIAGTTSGGFLYADVDALRQAALQVPWVRSINVRRVWPDTLHVSVSEHTAAARWGDQGLLSNEGKVFSPGIASYPPGLPELHGPASTQLLVLSQFRAMNKAIAPLNLHIKRIDLDARRAWRLSLDNGIELLLGRADSNTHLQQFVQIYPSLLDTPAGNNIERVDMRYGNGLAVRWGKN